MVTLNYMGR